MPYVIRHIETGEIVKMRSGKSVWAQPGHAKAAWKTSGLSTSDSAKFGYKIPAYGRIHRGWDHQNIFEIVEAKVEVSADMKQALALLKEATFELEPGTLVYQINKFLKEIKQ